MKRNFIALCALLLAACGSQEPKITLFSNEAFQTEADGKPVGIYTLRAGDVTMQVTNYGARVVSLWTPGPRGRLRRHRARLRDDRPLHQQ